MLSWLPMSSIRTRLRFCLLVVALGCIGTLFPLVHAVAEASLCATVSIQISQKASLERQGFIAEMKLNNGLTTVSITDVGVNLVFSDAQGNPVIATTDPNNLTAKFFVKPDGLSGINATDGTGTVAPATAASMRWLIIPAPGAGGTTPLGAQYWVGATLTYSMGTQPETVNVTPVAITVTPQPQLELDYFLANEVYADDPFTPTVEAPVPFTLGVRVKNSGFGAAKNMAIHSAQPKIVENQQGLLIGFQLTGSYVDDQSATNSLQVKFGDIAPQQTRMGRWTMETTLSGQFVEFSADYTHADSLGGELTSLINSVNTHLLVHDVRVDLPGRDAIRDFLALDGTVLRTYESNGTDSITTDVSASALLTGLGATRTLSFPATTGLVYARLPDPYQGQGTSLSAVRSDGKPVPAGNLWYSKTRNADLSWSYYINVFDANTPGTYQLTMNSPVTTTLSLSKLLNDNRKKDTDQFTVQIKDGTGTVLSSPLTSTTQGSGADITAGSGTTGVMTVTPGQTYTLQEIAAGSPLATLTDYNTQIVCSNAKTGSVTTLPNGAGQSFTLTPALGDAIACTLTNQAITTPPPANGQLSIQMALQPTNDPGLFNVQLNGTTVANNLGQGGGTGTLSLPAGTYTLNETAGMNTSLANYTMSISCNNGQSGTGATLPDIILTAGQSVSCTITNTRVATSPQWTLTKSILEGTTFIQDNQFTITYRLQVTNTGNTTGDYTLIDTPKYGVGVTMQSATVKKNGGLATTLSINPAIPTTAEWSLATQNALTAGSTDLYEVTVLFIHVSNRIFGDGFELVPIPPTPEEDCTLASGETGTGLLNTALLTAGSITKSASACELSPSAMLALPSLPVQ